MIYREVYGGGDSCELEVQSRGEAEELMLRGAALYAEENDDEALRALLEARDVPGVLKHLREAYQCEVMLP